MEQHDCVSDGSERLFASHTRISAALVQVAVLGSLTQVLIGVDDLLRIAKRKVVAMMVRASPPPPLVNVCSRPTMKPARSHTRLSALELVSDVNSPNRQLVERSQRQWPFNVNNVTTFICLLSLFGSVSMEAAGAQSTATTTGISWPPSRQKVQAVRIRPTDSAWTR